LFTDLLTTDTIRRFPKKHLDTEPVGIIEVVDCKTPTPMSCCHIYIL